MFFKSKLKKTNCLGGNLKPSSRKGVLPLFHTIWYLVSNLIPKSPRGEGIHSGSILLRNLNIYIFYIPKDSTRCNHKNS